MKKNLLKSLAIVASVAISVSANAQYVWKDINNGTNTGSKWAIFCVDDNTLLGSSTFNIFKSTDKGDNWTSVSNYGAHRFIKTNSGKLISVGSKVMASTDNGDSWTEVPITPGSIASSNDIVKANNGDLFLIRHATGASSWAVTGVYKSTDDGVTWTMLGTLISTQYILGTTALWSLWTEDGNTIIVSGHTTLNGAKNTIRSTDGGATWSYVIDETFNRFAKKSDGTIIGMGVGEGVYYSTDTGATFTKVGGNAGHVYYDMLISNDTIFAAHYNFGVRAFSAIDYSDLGLIGSATNGLSSTKIRGIATNNTGDLFAASEIDGKFHTTASGGGTTGISETLTENTFLVYPNPANEMVTIGNLPSGSILNITDITGKVIYNAVIKNEQTTINTTDFVNGIYILQVSNNGIVSTKKLVVNN